MSSQLTMVVMMQTGRMIYNSLPVRTGVLKLFSLFFTSTSSKTIQGEPCELLSVIIKGHLTACFILNAKRKIRIAREGSGTSVAKFWGLYHQYHQSLSPIPLGLRLRFKRSRALKGLEAEAPKAEAHLSDGKWHLSAASEDNAKFWWKSDLNDLRIASTLP